MCLAAKGTPFEDDIHQTGSQTFPDIIAKKYYGAEVKVTSNTKWISTGNSILEGTRDKDVQKIYIFFGKFGGTPEIKFRPYQDCLYDIGVTHSPRYKIDMDLAEGQSIFSKIGVEYDTLRQESNPIKRIKNYYRENLSKGEELWWIESPENTVSPIIRSLNSFTKEEKSKFITETMILFPEIFGNSRMKFERVAAYLITDYNAVTSYLRDYFTSGGREKILVNGEQFLVPKILYHLKEKANEISITIERLDEAKLLNYWRVDSIPESRISYWKTLLNTNDSQNNEEFSAIDIFNSGL